MVEAILCDIDGTLVESNWLHAEAWQISFGAIGIHLELDEVRRQIGKGGEELIPVFVPWWKRSAVEEPLKAFRRHIFQQDYMQRVQPLPQVRAFVERVKSAGIRFALASSAQASELEQYTRIAQIDDLVDVATSADDAKKAKPHPDIFEAALSRLKLRATQCIALGDTPYDAESAGKAGVRTIGVTTGGWSCEELMAAGCVEVYESVADLLHHFDQSALMRTGLH